MKNLRDGKEDIDAKLFGQMLRSAQEEIESLGNAKIGDKTLMDTLVPSLSAYDTAIEKGNTFSIALQKMNIVTEKGYKYTKDIVSKIGSVSRLGERSRGVLNAGATSCYLLLSSMVASTKKLLGGNL